MRDCHLLVGALAACIGSLAALHRNAPDCFTEAHMDDYARFSDGLEKIDPGAHKAYSSKRLDMLRQKNRLTNKLDPITKPFRPKQHTVEI